MGEGAFHPQLTGTYQLAPESEVQQYGRIRTAQPLPSSLLVKMRMAESAGRLIPVTQIQAGNKNFAFGLGQILSCSLVNDSVEGSRQICEPLPNPIFRFREPLGSLEPGCSTAFEYRIKISWNVDLSKFISGYSLTENTRAGTPVTISAQDYASLPASPAAQAEIRNVVERDHALIVTFDVTKMRVQQDFSGCTRATPPSSLNAVPTHWKVSYRNDTPWQHQSLPLTTPVGIRVGNQLFTQSAEFNNQLQDFFAPFLNP